MYVKSVNLQTSLLEAIVVYQQQTSVVTMHPRKKYFIFTQTFSNYTWLLPPFASTCVITVDFAVLTQITSRKSLHFINVKTSHKIEERNDMPVKGRTFRHTFNTNFNLKFRHPRSDTCSECDRRSNSPLCVDPNLDEG